ncbi:tRNA guanosine(34) transglycosylase Tgt [Paludisphaera borealis]|uniref:Queuine tRNA-ribosyltransferase n=1 Tax=Paludisphaera borealis TaxID=1387353 RepID=A0A1U7CRM2_9BACT|nr:tRNA guanosine(34) transglycosylase Tgt [Paludisphaera borealis]APW61582.1 Queuine tRNA-ribosyltransferase [Paludisphaera borealis]
MPDTETAPERIPHGPTTDRPVRFSTLARDAGSAARAGRLETPHGAVETPAFMPVGTQGTVKGLTPDQLWAGGSRMILANTYHLALRPGEETVAALGGLHRFTGWDGPILTDSGGFQVFSLAQRAKITDHGASFRSHLDGRLLELTPERAVAIQEALGADVAMCLDHCPALPAGKDAIARAVDRTIAWAGRCKAAHARADQALFGIVQGGAHEDLRARCAEALVALDFDGYAVGGVSVGESREEVRRALAVSTHRLPEDRPRYLMGVGRPQDLLDAVATGIDLFDCVMPTRNGRNATCFTDQGLVKLRNAAHTRDASPLEAGCDCLTCAKFSRGYLRHLFMAKEMLGPILASIHNLAYLHRLTSRMREAIRAGRFVQLRMEVLEALGP